MNSRYDHVLVSGRCCILCQAKILGPIILNSKYISADEPPPYNYLSGSYEKMRSLGDALSQATSAIKRPILKWLEKKKLRR